MLIGVIADTHGYFDQRTAAAFAGVEAILLAGDIGGHHVIAALSALAPVHAVYGNNDEKRATLGLPLHADVALGGVRFHIVHQLPHARPGPDTQAVVFGHSHRPIIENRRGVLHVNPGRGGTGGIPSRANGRTHRSGRRPHHVRANHRVGAARAEAAAERQRTRKRAEEVTVGLLDELDREAEAFAEAVDREHYLQGSGRKDTLELAPIYDRHERLFRRETIDALQAADHADERWPELRRLAIEGYLDAAANALTEEIASRETADTVEWDGEAVPYRAVGPLIRNEADPGRRHDLERRLVAATAAQNPLRERRWDALYKRGRELGYESYRSMCEDVGRLDIAALAALCERFLRETDADYRSQVVERLRGIGIDPAFAEKSDLAYVFRAPEYDAWFAAEKLVDVYSATIAGLGLTGDEQRRITLDVEPRPKKSPRAFCAAPRVPNEIYLVTNPQGGQYDYETMLHEGGHAEHFAHVDGSLPFSLRGLGDNSVTEGFAFVLEHICSEPGWLSAHLGFDDPWAYLRMQRFNRLYMFRRYSAKLLYEAELHSSDNVRGHQKRYADLLTAATGVRYAPEDYLFDVDDAFYCARYLRAWIFDAQLRARLRERFGGEWWCNPAAGAKLAELWSHGQRYTAPELLEREGLEPLDVGPLMRELEPA